MINLIINKSCLIASRSLWRTLSLACVLLAGLSLDGLSQTQLSVYGPHHYNVRSYDGLIHSTDHTIHIQLPDQHIRIENWSLRATIEQPLNSSPKNVSG